MSDTSPWRFQAGKRRRKAPIPQSRCPKCGLETNTADVVESSWIENDIGDGWTAAYRIAEEHGQPVIAEVRVFPTERNGARPGTWNADIDAASLVIPPGGLRTRKIREVSPEKALAQLRGPLADSLENAAARSIANDASYAAAGAALGLRDNTGLRQLHTGTPGRPVVGEEFLARLAEMFVKVGPVRGGPYKVLKAQLEDQGIFVADRTIRGYIGRAKNRGLYRPDPSPSGRVHSQGVRSGSLTDEGRRVLKAAKPYRPLREAFEDRGRKA